MAAAILLTIVICLLPVFYSLYKTFLQGRYWRNPLLNPVFLQPVSKRSASTDSLRDVFAENKVPQDLDAIVIGSGIGGLAAAALLSKCAKRVLVLEQHDRAGGCCHTFEEKGYKFDSGVHYLGDINEGMLKSTLMAVMSKEGITTKTQLSDFVKFADVGDVYDRVVFLDDKSKSYDIKTRDTFIDELVKHFPEERKSLEKYIELVEDCKAASIGGYYLTKYLPAWMYPIVMATFGKKFYNYASQSAQQIIERVTSNKTLRAVLGYLYADYGNDLATASFAIHSLTVHHLLNRCFYPEDGPSTIPAKIIETIEHGGGRVLVQATVTKILTSNGKAYGVEVSKGSRTFKIQAPIVISNAGLRNTFCSLVERQPKTEKLALAASNMRPSSNHCSVFIGLKKSAAELGLEKCNYWIFPNQQIQEEFDRYMSTDKEKLIEQIKTGKLDIPSLFISFPSVKDPLWDEKNPGKSTCIALFNSNYTWFKEWEDTVAQKRGSEYTNFKGALHERALEIITTIFPQLSDAIDYLDTSTPLTAKHYLAAMNGESYGLAHDIDRFTKNAWIRPDTPIQGLYLTGQDVSVGGFAGAIMGAVGCCSAVLKRNVYLDVRDVAIMRGEDYPAIF